MKTRIIILTGPMSDAFAPEKHAKFDLLIHCGSLTENSTWLEFRKVLYYLRRFDVGVKILIGGSKDISLDRQAYLKHCREQPVIKPDSPPDDADPNADQVDAGAPLVESGTKIPRKNRKKKLKRQKVDYGLPSVIRLLVKSEKGVHLLGEGMHEVALPNRRPLRLYVRPSRPNEEQDRTFQRIDFGIEPDVDIVVTYGPPFGILDRTPPESSPLCCRGSTSLWHAIKAARPRLHCFGQENTWRGAAIATWQGSGSPLWTTEVEAGKLPFVDAAFELSVNAKLITETTHFLGDDYPVGPGQTLFVNACSSLPNGATQPWIMNIDLPAHIGGV